MQSIQGMILSRTLLCVPWNAPDNVIGWSILISLDRCMTLDYSTAHALHYSLATGSTSANACDYCPKGSTTFSSGSSSLAECQLCPPGTHTVAFSDGGGCQVKSQ